MRKEYVIPPITEYVFKRGITILYLVAAIPLTYYTWPWGLLFTGPTFGGATVWAFSSKRKIESSTQTTESDIPVSPVSVEDDVQPGDPSLRVMIAPSAPSLILHSFQNKPDPTSSAPICPDTNLSNKI